MNHSSGQLYREKSLKEIFTADDDEPFGEAHGQQERERTEFEKYNELQQSRAMFLTYCALYCVILAALFTAKIISISAVMNKASESLVKFHVVTMFFDLILFLDLLMLMAIKSWRGDELVSGRLLPLKGFLQSTFVIGNTIYLTMLLNAKSSFGECDSENNFVLGLYCNQFASAHGPAPDILAALIVLPMAFYFVMRDTRFEAIMLSWLISVVASLVNLFNTIRWHQWVHPVVPVLFLAVGTFMIYYESHRQNLAMYLLTKKLQLTLNENEKLADETHANEMRAMIANVAHDLKTPLTSFLSGVDFIKHLIEDGEDRLMAMPEGDALCQDLLVPMSDCLSGIHNTNAFMIMTINRCIDYTKASKGMKLSPKPETIDLQDTLELPLRVMRDMQQRREIVLDDAVLRSSEVCSHIITDKQWLQENLLCLLSNAVKYSSKGRVDIKVSLVPQRVVVSRKGAGKRRGKLKLKTAAASVSSATSWWPKSKGSKSYAAHAVAPVDSIHDADKSNGGAGAAAAEGVAPSEGEEKREDGSAVGASQSLMRAHGEVDEESASDVSSDEDDVDDNDDEQAHARVKGGRGTLRGSILGELPSHTRIGAKLNIANIVKSHSLVSKVRTKYQQNPSVAAPSIKSLSTMFKSRQGGGMDGANGASSSRSFASFSSMASVGNLSRNVSVASSLAGDAHTGPSLAGTVAGRGVGSGSGIAAKSMAKDSSGFFASNASLISIAEQASDDPEKKMLLFEVLDTGIGLSEEAMKKLFNPFKQAQRLAGGTGLGLYSLAKRIEALGGHYGVKKRPDGKQGSLFWFAFAYRPDKVSAAMHERSRAARRLGLGAAAAAQSPGTQDSNDYPSTTGVSSNAEGHKAVPSSIKAMQQASASAASAVSHNQSDRSTQHKGQKDKKAGARIEKNEEEEEKEKEDEEDEESGSYRTLGIPVLEAGSDSSRTVGAELAPSLSFPLPAISPSASAGAAGAAAGFNGSFPSIGGQQLSPQTPKPAPKLSKMSKSVSRIIDTYQTPPHMDVLLVDDAISILKMTSMMLKRQGHVVTQAENGAEALEMMLDRYSVDNKPFDVVLMDLQMPVMDGLEAVRRLRAEEGKMSLKRLRSTSVPLHELPPLEDSLEVAHEGCTEVVMMLSADNKIAHSYRVEAIADHRVNALTKIHQLVIGCSANSDHETMQEALKAGVDAFMAKPFSVETFYEIISQLRVRAHG